MKIGSVMLYYNSEFGFIFAPETTIRGSLISTKINPVIVEKKDIGIEKIGIQIFESLKRSRESLPVERSEIENFNFWQISGIKSYSSFSKKFKCIEVREEKDKICITKLIRYNDGSYSYPDNNEELGIQLNESNKNLGRIVLEQLEETEANSNYESMSFTSVNERSISYIRPNDEYEDLGDGHTDAYQIFSYSSNENNYIAFMIDSGYAGFNELAIKSRWKKMYGKLIEFRFESVQNEPYVLKIIAKTKYKNIVSHIFKDGDGMLEILYELDLKTDDKLRSEIKEQFVKVIDSIKIE